MLFDILGDVHGKEFQSNNALVQVGDCGFRKAHERFLKQRKDNQYILFGNHDYYPMLYEEHSLFDYATINTSNHNILCIRGAYSIDKEYRKEGIDWWEEEQLSYRQGLGLVDGLREGGERFNIIISHECPMFVKRELFGYHNKTLTNQLLEIVQEIVQPEMWYFGHYHRDEEYFANNTYFRCLAELSKDTFDIEKFEVKKYKL